MNRLKRKDLAGLSKRQLKEIIIGMVNGEEVEVETKFHYEPEDDVTLQDIPGFKEFIDRVIKEG